MIKEKKKIFFLVFLYFPKKAQNKTRSGSRRPFLNDENT